MVNPNTVARPTSDRVCACFEYTDAPSIPINAHTVNSMMPCTCSITDKPLDSPQKSMVNVSMLNPKNATNTTNARIGTNFATVVIAFMILACLIPLVSTPKIIHVNADTASACAHRCCSVSKMGR